MSFSQKTEYQERRYNLDDPSQRDMIKNFERQLNGRSFEVFLLAEGLLTKRFPYQKQGAIVYERLEEYQEACKKWAALSTLRNRQAYAEREEHIANFGGECSDAQCVYCRTWFKRNRQFLLNNFSVEGIASVVGAANDEIRAEDIPF